MTEDTFQAWLAHIELADMAELERLSQVFAVSSSVLPLRRGKLPRKTKHWRLRWAIANRMGDLNREERRNRFRYWMPVPGRTG